MTRDMFMIQVLHLNEAIGRLIDLAVFKVPQENKEELFKFLTTNLPAKSDIVMQDGFIALSAERKALLESSIEKMVPVKLSTRDKINARGKIPKGKSLPRKGKGKVTDLDLDLDLSDSVGKEYAASLVKKARIELGETLADIRKGAGWTKAELSRKLIALKSDQLPVTISASDISKLERGDALVKVGISKLVSIVRAMASNVK